MPRGGVSERCGGTGDPLHRGRALVGAHGEEEREPSVLREQTLAVCHSRAGKVSRRPAGASKDAFSSLQRIFHLRGSTGGHPPGVVLQTHYGIAPGVRADSVGVRDRAGVSSVSHVLAEQDEEHQATDS